MLVSKCRIYDEDSRACSTHYKSISKNNQYRRKSYITQDDKDKQRTSNERKPSEGENLTSVKCGELGHYANECRYEVLRCFKCGKTGHRVANCKSIGWTYYNCGKQGHISTNSQKPKKVQS